MKAYNLDNMKISLQEAAQHLRGRDILQIAAIEQLDQSTVRSYLKGNITKPAIGKAILSRCREILIKRNIESKAA